MYQVVDQSWKSLVLGRVGMLCAGVHRLEKSGEKQWLFFFYTFFLQKTWCTFIWAGFAWQIGFAKWGQSKVCSTCLFVAFTSFTRVSQTTKIGGRLRKQQSSWLEPISSPEQSSGRPYRQQQSATVGHYSSLPQSRYGGAGTQNSHARVTEGVTKARCAEGT